MRSKTMTQMTRTSRGLRSLRELLGTNKYEEATNFSNSSLSESLGSRRGQLLLDELLRPYEREGSTIITPDILTMVGEKGERLLPGCFAGLTSMPISNEASIDSSYFDSRVLVDAATTAFYEELTALTKACAQLYE